MMAEESHSLSIAIEPGEQTLIEQVSANQTFIDSGIDAGELGDAANKGAVWMQVRHTESVSSRPVRIRVLDLPADKPMQLLVNVNKLVIDEVPRKPLLKREEKNYSIWFKPSGMLCQGTRWGDHCSLARVVELTMSRPVHVVHRLDKAASGLILLAHTRPAAKALSSMFARRQVKKIYRASVHGLVDWSLPHVMDDAIDEKKAKTTVLTVDTDEENNTSRLSLQIETGRKHQIRQHLAEAGFPILGDRLFDSTREHVTDLQLSATELGFECPFSGQNILVTGD